MRRTVSWNESRFAKFLKICRLPDFSARLWGFIECPPEIGIFHHGCWLGSRSRLVDKASKSSHQENNFASYPEAIDEYPTTYVPTGDLPTSIRRADWPTEFFEQSMLTGADGNRRSTQHAHGVMPADNLSQDLK